LFRLDRTYQPFRVAAQGAADGRAGQERLLLAVPVDADELHVGEERFENRRVAPGLDQQGSLRLNPHGEHQLIKDSSVHQADASSKSAMSASTQADSCFSASGTGSNVPVRRYAFSASLSSVASQRTVGDSSLTRPSPRPLKPPTSISPRASACSPRASSPSSASSTFSATTLSAKAAPGCTTSKSYFVSPVSFSRLIATPSRMAVTGSASTGIKSAMRIREARTVEPNSRHTLHEASHAHWASSRPSSRR